MAVGKVVIFLVLLVSLISGQYQSNEPLEEGPPSPHVGLSYVFPHNSDHVFPPGEVAEALIGFRNNAKRAMKITAVMASLLHPADSTYVIQNYTALHYGIDLQGGSEVSLQYFFMPDKMLETMKYDFVIYVYYSDKAMNRTSVVANTTLTIEDGESSFDMPVVFASAITVAVLCVAGFIILNGMGGKKKNWIGTGIQNVTKQGGKSASQEPTKKANGEVINAENDYLSNTPGMNLKRGRK